MKAIKMLENLVLKLNSVKNDVTEKEFLKRVKQIQRDEVKTENFRLINDFMNRLYIRDCLYKETEIFSKLNHFKEVKEKYLFDKSYYEASCLIIWTDLRQIATSITYEQEDSNPFLELFTQLMHSSLEDCKTIITQINDKYPNIELDCLGQTLEINLEIPNKLKNILPMYVSKTIPISYSKSGKETVNYVDRLSDKEMHVYEDYNKFVTHILEMAETIYRLRLFQLLRDNAITPLYFNIMNNELECGLIISFYYKNIAKKNDERVFEIYKNRIQKFTEVTGLSFEEMIHMKPDDFERYVNETFKFCIEENFEGVPVLEPIDNLDMEKEEEVSPKTYVLEQSKN